MEESLKFGSRPDLTIRKLLAYTLSFGDDLLVIVSMTATGMIIRHACYVTKLSKDGEVMAHLKVDDGKEEILIFFDDLVGTASKILVPACLLAMMGKDKYITPERMTEGYDGRQWVLFKPGPSAKNTLILKGPFMRKI